MKKIELENIEKIKEKRELSKEAKDKIIGRVVANSAIGIAICILIYTFKIASNLLVKEAATFVYNVYSIEILVFALILLEIAYKKDSGKWAASGMEMLVLAVFMLFSPYIYLKFNNKIMYPIIATVAIYYIAKVIAIYFMEKKQYLNDISDIQEIIKKESQDDKAQEEKTKILEEMEQKRLEAEREKIIEETIEVKEKPKRKTTKTKKSEAKGTSKKTSTTKKKTETKTTAKKEKAETKKTTTKKKTTTNAEKEEKDVPKKTTRKTTKTTDKVEKEEKPKTTRSKTTSKPKTTTTKPKNTSKKEKETAENVVEVVETPAPKKRGRPRKNPETKKES